MACRRWGSVYRFALVSLFIFGIKGCSGVGTQPPASFPSSQVPSLGKLYIANAGGGDLLFYDQAAQAVGNRPPSGRLSAGVTGPVGLFLDKTNDRLYIANADQNAVLIFEGVSQMTSQGAPTVCSTPVSPPCLRIFSGVNSQINRPYGVFVDTAADRLYVANANNGTTQVANAKPGNVLIFDGASGLNGDAAPSRSLGGPLTTLDFPRALYVDTDRDLLYVSNSGHNSILVFTNASTIDGEIAPAKIIQPPDTRTQDLTCSQDLSCLNLPFGILVDKANDRLYVANTGLNQSSILIFENASTRSATALPEHVLTGNATLIADPVGLDLDTSSNTLYVTNQGDITEKFPPLDQSDTATRIPLDSLVTFKDLVARCGSSGVCAVAPDRIIQGRGTGLSDPAGVAVDTTTGLTYVANAAANQVSVYGLTGNIPPTQLIASPTGLAGQIVTMLNTPVGIFYDAANDRLYVANYNGINNSPALPALLVWEKASQIPFFSPTPAVPPCPQGTTCTQTQTDFAAEVPPTWWINAGGNVIQPIGVYADNSRNLLIVLDGASTGGSLVGLDLSTLPANPIGAQSPSASWAVTGLFKPRGLAVDAGRGNVYVSYDECLFSSGCIPPAGATPSSVEVRDITNGTVKSQIDISSIPSLTRPFGLAIDPGSDVLYVANLKSASGAGADAVLALQNASTLGSATLQLTLFGSNTGIANPQAVAVDPANDRLFVANTQDQSIRIFDQVSTLTGSANVSPARVIQGASTGLTYLPSSSVSYNPVGLFVDVSTGEEAIYTTEPSCPASVGTCKGAILLFSVEGNLPPAEGLSGSQGLFSNTLTAGLDESRDILYLATRGGAALADDRVYALRNASAAQADQTPDVALCSPQAASSPCLNTRLSNPQGLAVDPSRDLLYVANGAAGGPPDANLILVFSNASALTGDATPFHLLSSTEINDPQGLALDRTNDALYVANSGGNNVLVYSQASGKDGSVSPDRVLTLSGVAGPIAAAIDPLNDLLYVAVPRQGTGSTATLGSVLMIKGASGQNGSVTPTAVIGGTPTDPSVPSFTLNNPSALFLDLQNDILYIADADVNAVYVFENASRINASTLPTRTLVGSQTVLNQPTGVAVDPTR